MFTGVPLTGQVLLTGSSEAGAAAAGAAPGIGASLVNLGAPSLSSVAVAAASPASIASFGR